MVFTVQLTDVYDKQSLVLGTEADVLWYRPSSLKELLSLKSRYRHARLVSGATTVGLLICLSFLPFFLQRQCFCPSNLNSLVFSPLKIITFTPFTILQLIGMKLCAEILMGLS